MNLNIAELQRVCDLLGCILYVHPDDAEHPIAKSLEEVGYKVVSRAVMVKGKAFIQSPAKVGIIDFASGKAMLAENPTLSFFEPLKPHF